jgi:ATP binding protein
MNFLSKLQFKNFRLVSDLTINLHPNLNIIASNKAGIDCSVVLKGLSIALNDLSYSKQELNRKENKDMLLQLYLNNLNDLTDLTVRTNHTDRNEVTSSTNNHESLNVDSPIIQYNQHTWNGGYSPLFDYVQNIIRQPYSHNVELDKAFIDSVATIGNMSYLDLPKGNDYFAYPESKDFFTKFVSVLNRVLEPTGWTFGHLVSGYIGNCYLKHSNFNCVHLDNLGCDIQFIFKLLFKLCCHKNSNMDYKDVVLINNIENNLHPSLQQSLILTLQTEFPNLQFIVTTNSPNIINCVHKTQLHIINEYYGINELLPLIKTYGEPVGSVQFETLNTNPRPHIPEREKLDKLLILAEAYDVDYLESNQEFLDLLSEMENILGRNSDVIGSVYRTLERKKRFSNI